MADERIRLSTDALIAMIVTEAEERELSELPDIEVMNEEFHPSERFQQKMAALFRTVERRRSYKKAKSTAKKLFLAMTVSVSVLFCCLLPAKAVREAVVTTLIEWHDKFVSVIFSSEGTTAQGFLPAISLGYIPEGFAEEVSTNDDERYYAYFSGPDDASYFVNVVPIEKSQTVYSDNEHTTYYSLKFDSQQALWGAHEDGTNMLIWNSKELSFVVSGRLDLSEIIKIAENISLSAN